MDVLLCGFGHVNVDLLTGQIVCHIFDRQIDILLCGLVYVYVDVMPG